MFVLVVARRGVAEEKICLAHSALLSLPPPCPKYLSTVDVDLIKPTHAYILFYLLNFYLCIATEIKIFCIDLVEDRYRLIV